MIEDLGGVFAIDSQMHGLKAITAVYYLPGPRPAIIETAPATSLGAVLAGLTEAGVEDLDWIVVTHIHLDHAGAAGDLAERFPGARVVVRAEGAPHLADPNRLWASAARLYDDMEGLWGWMRPVPAERIDAVSEDGVVADLGDGRRLEALYTPGHAAHHMALFEPSSGDVFAGDALGVCLPGAGVLRPATPPPEFDLEAALDSIERIRRLRPRRLLPTHYGAAPSTDPLLDAAGERLREAVELAEKVVAEGGGLAAIREAFRKDEEARAGGLDQELDTRLAHTTSYDLNARGIARYLTKRRGIPVGP
jgi:glyoxylase-like metal-dependent hydrolase (beta-lactamase superfamily II)